MFWFNPTELWGRTLAISTAFSIYLSLCVKSTDSDSFWKGVSRIRQKVFRAGARGSTTELLNILPFFLSPLFMASGTCCKTMMNSGNYTGGKRELTKAIAEDSSGKYSPRSVGGLVLC